MNDLYRLLNEERTREFSLRGTAVTLRLLSARELMELRRTLTPAQDDFETALQGSAALVAAALRQGGKPVFDDAAQVLDTLSVEEINAAADAYRAWSEEIDPGVHSDAKVVNAIKKA